MSAAPAREGRALDRHFLSGLAWTGFVKWGSQGLSWISTLIVARLLSPEDFGIFGMTVVYLTFVSVMSESGLGFSVVRNRGLTAEQLQQINTLSVLLGIGGTLLTCLAAAPLAHFYRVPALVGVVTAMSATLFISSFRTVPGALLNRDLEFRSLALIEGTQATVQATTVVVLAFLGFHYWSFVIGMIAGQTAALAVSLCYHRFGFSWPRMSVIGDAFRYGRQILGGQMAWYVVSSSDLAIVGRVLGQSAAGAYTMAFTIASTPIDKVTALVGRVAFPMFSHVRDDPRVMRRYLLTLTEGLALACFPLAIGLALVADRFVPVVLGAKWHDAIAPLAILAFLTVIRCFTPLISHVLNATGHQRFAMYNGFLMAVLGPILFYLGAKWGGLAGVALGWLGLMAATLPFITVVTLRVIRLPFRSYLSALGPAAGATLVMTAAVLAARFLADRAGAAERVSLPIEVAAGAVGYVGTVFAFHRRRIASILALIRGRQETPESAHPEAAPAPVPSES